MLKLKRVSKLATLPVVLSQTWIGSAYRARPVDFQTGFPFLVSLVSSNTPDDLILASRCKFNSLLFSSKWSKLNDWVSVEFTLLRTRRNKVREMNATGNFGAAIFAYSNSDLMHYTENMVMCIYSMRSDHTTKLTIMPLNNLI
ncbi:hypothetical protein VNO78_21698 [Psophocarpus tetragonolobus]|uniref:Uncharacterized protein n=1 Tax=Psophocarpus tetragonolobus TaxID=3891 RepID=A0AAN9XIK3_PSOTE